MATLTAQSAELTALLKKDPVQHGVKAEVAINIALIVLTTFSHCLGVKVNVRGHTCWIVGLLGISYMAKSSE
jgi:hypothetical protein